MQAILDDVAETEPRARTIQPEQIVNLAKWIWDKFVELLKGAAAPVFMFQHALEWQDVKGMATGVQGVLRADQLSVDDQVFVAAFVRSHGSIKEMERIFGVSYPTIKSRLNRIAERLDFVDTDPAPTGADVVDRLRRGEINVQEALAELEGSR